MKLLSLSCLLVLAFIFNSKANNTEPETTPVTTESVSTEEFGCSIYFKYPCGESKDRIYIHYGSNGSSVTSTSKCSSATVNASSGKVYYSFSGKKNDMKYFMEVSSGDCGKKIDMSDYL
jgi:hypothetical protein